jgi:hypothetical protein
VTEIHNKINLKYIVLSGVRIVHRSVYVVSLRITEDKVNVSD